MKIGIISNLYPPFVRGGAEIIAAMQAEGLKKSWQHVFAISSRPKDVKIFNAKPFKSGWWSLTKDEVKDVEVIRFHPVNLYYYLDDYRHPSFVRLLWHLIDSFNLFSYFTVKKILEKEKPDLVITHNLMGLGFLIPKLLKKLNIRHVHVLHDVQLVTPSGLILKDEEQALKHKFFHWIGYVKVMRWLMGSPEIIVSPSKFLLNFYKQSKFFPKSQKHFLPNPLKSLVDLKKQPSASLELVYLGQIHKAKGVLDLIKNFKELKLPHVHLNVIGVGQDLEQAKALAKGDKRIKFYGWMPHDKLVPLFSKLDVMIVPSLCYENSPAVIYESLAMGIPVLAADIGGTAELIQEGINGWTFPAGDFVTLNKKIASLYKQREKIQAMSVYCQASVQEHTLDNYIDKILKIINKDEKQKEN